MGAGEDFRAKSSPVRSGSVSGVGADRRNGVLFSIFHAGGAISVHLGLQTGEVPCYDVFSSL
jgi:hypothetical protein